MASVQVVDNQGDALDNSSDTQPREKDRNKKNLLIFDSSLHLNHTGVFLGNDVHGREPSIQRLAVHEENMQTVYFQENDVAEVITNPKNTTLLSWFKLNQVDADAWILKYHEIPEHYVWHQAQHCWRKGKEEGALAAFTQQIHLRVKGTICASFSITSQVQEVLKTSRCPQMVYCLEHSRKQQ